MTDLTALSYTVKDEWVSIDGDIATFGITDHAADELGDVVFVELPAVGTEVVAGAVCAEIESTKSVCDMYAPLTGRVVEVNADVDADPSLLNSDPFGRGWIFRVELSGERAALLDREAYLAQLGGHA